LSDIAGSNLPDSKGGLMGDLLAMVLAIITGQDNGGN
jgi:hypothetical protein